MQSQASGIAQTQNGGEQVAAILNPVRGYRDSLRRKGVAPRDHARENALAIRSLERAVQQQIQLRNAPHTSPETKPAKYQSVQSRLTQSTAASRLGVAKVAGKQTYLRRKPNDAYKFNTPTKSSNQEQDGTSEFGTPNTVKTARSRKSDIAEHSVPRKQAVPKATELNTLAPRATKNFVSSNAKNITIEAKKRFPKSPVHATPERESTTPMLRKGFGKVPTYLKERKSKWEMEARIRQQNLEDDCPPGMMRVPDDERLATLKVLQEKLEAVRKEMQRLPLLIETVGQRRRKAALDKEYEESEEAVRIFSKEKVFVQA